MPSVTMYDLTAPSGKTHWIGWLMFIASLALILFTIYDIYQRNQQNKRDASQEFKISELEMNLKKIMGDSYQSISSNTNTRFHGTNQAQIVI